MVPETQDQLEKMAMRLEILEEDNQKMKEDNQKMKEDIQRLERENQRLRQEKSLMRTELIKLKYPGMKTSQIVKAKCMGSHF